MTNILTVDTRECSSDATNFPAAVEHNGTSTLSARNRVTSAKPPGRERLYRSVSLLGPKVNPMSDADVVSIVSDAIRNRLHIIVANHNLHSVYLWYRQERMRLFYENAPYTHIDGMGLILLATAPWGIT